MSHGLKLLLIAAGAIITCIVVVVGFQLTKSGKSDANKAAEQYANILSNYDNIQLTVYENTQVSGADVINFIKDNAGAVVEKQITKIVVNTNAQGGSQSYGNAEYSKVEDLKSALEKKQESKTSKEYINPS